MILVTMALILMRSVTGLYVPDVVAILNACRVLERLRLSLDHGPDAIVDHTLPLQPASQILSAIQGLSSLRQVTLSTSSLLRINIIGPRDALESLDCNGLDKTFFGLPFSTIIRIEIGWLFEVGPQEDVDLHVRLIREGFPLHEAHGRLELVVNRSAIAMSEP